MKEYKENFEDISQERILCEDLIKYFNKESDVHELTCRVN